MKTTPYNPKPKPEGEVEGARDSSINILGIRMNDVLGACVEVFVVPPRSRTVDVIMLDGGLLKNEFSERREAIEILTWK